MIKYVYKVYFPVIRNFIVRNSGTLNDVEDVFQDTLIVLFDRCSDPAFKLTAKLSSYLFSVSRHIWLQRLNRQHGLFFSVDYEVNEAGSEYEIYNPDLQEINLARYKLFFGHYDSLSVECKLILMLYANEKKMTEIAQIMGYADDDTAKSRKHHCKRLFMKKISNDPRFKNLIEYELQ